MTHCLARPVAIADADDHIRSLSTWGCGMADGEDSERPAWELPSAPPHADAAARDAIDLGTAPPGYEPYGHVERARLNGFFFALAVHCGFRAAQDVLTIVVMLQSDATEPLWGVGGWLQVTTLATLWTLAAIGFMLNKGWARLVSIITDLLFLLIVFIWWSDLPDYGYNTTILAKNLVAPAISLTLAVMATPARRNRRARSSSSAAPGG